eukprot:gene21883-28329_t
MNIKAEKIEQIIQIVNRNLLLVFAGQISDIVQLENRELQKVDAVIFGHDRFAYEMVHYVKAAIHGDNRKEKMPGMISNSNDVLDDGTSRQDLWDRIFSDGLELLLVECAMVNDDIERDCFISRVYCWFTEKLTERRELPRKARGVAELKELKKSLRSMKLTESHTMRGLEKSYIASIQPNHSQALHEVTSTDGPHTNEAFPSLNMPETTNSKLGNRNIPLYVKNNMPAVLVNKPDHKNFLPKIPGVEDNYGMMYNPPETEAERTMNELWVARRRQEAFEWKTQQHLALVMDRLALHKSRLEAEALRRQESSALLKIRSSKTAEDVIVDRFGRTLPGGASRNWQSADGPRKGRHHHSRSRSRRRGESSSMGSNDDGSSTSAFSSPERSVKAENDARLVLTNGIPEAEVELTVAKPGRVGVLKQATHPQSQKRDHAPMKFKTELKGNFSDYLPQENYMQISDSDDDDKPDRGTSKPAHAAHGGNRKKGSKPTAAQIHFKHEKPVVRERPQSAKVFRAIAMDDPELKVFYRHSNFRRMPMTAQQEKWVEKLFDDRAAKAAKKKDKGGDKDKKKDGKKKDKDKDKGKVENVEKPKPIYKSADHFMATHFPAFEGDDDPEAIGPMRTVQLMEVATILGSCEESGVHIRESTLRKALVIPQDKPEAVCLEAMKTELEGFAVNPLPKDYWREMKMGKKKGKGGKKKKKKA